MATGIDKGPFVATSVLGSYIQDGRGDFKVVFSCQQLPSWCRWRKVRPQGDQNDVEVTCVTTTIVDG